MQKKPLPLSPKTSKRDEIIRDTTMKSPTSVTRKLPVDTKKSIVYLKTDPSGELTGSQSYEKTQTKESFQLTKINLPVKSPQGSLPKLAKPLLPHERLSPINGRETYYNLSKEIDRKVVELLRSPRVPKKKVIKKPPGKSETNPSEKTKKIISVKLTKKESQKPKEKKKEELKLPKELKERFKILDTALLVRSSEGRSGPNGYKGYSEYLNQQNFWGERYHDQASYNYNLLMKKTSPSALDYSKVFIS